MAFLKTKNVAFRGIAAAVPERVEYNRDYPFMAAEQLEQYIKATGVESRHCAVHDGTICTSDLCYASAEKLIERLGWERSDIDLLLFVSHTADYKLPATACVLQQKLGLSTGCMAFDIPLGCSGYVYGLSVAANMLESGFVRKALLMVGNTQSVYASPEDPGTALLFGDSGSVTALEYDPNASPMFFNLSSDGSGKEFLIVPDGGCRNPFTVESTVMRDCGDGRRRSNLHERMDGAEVFSFALRRAPESILQLSERFEIDLSSVDYLLLHQANRFLCEKIRKKLKFDESKTPYNIDRFGNTSGGSIPLLMTTELAEKLPNERLTLMACGFGVGLSWGSVCFTTDRTVCLPLIYI